MTFHTAIWLGSILSVVLTALALGFNAAMGEITYLLAHPQRFAKSILAIDIIMPLFVLGILAVTSLPGPVKIALAALSVSPIAPTMPEHAMKAGGRKQHAISLLVAVSVIAFAFVPLSVEALGKVRGVEGHIPVFTVVRLMAVTVLGPLIVGITVRKFWPVFAERMAAPLSKFANILLILCLIAVLPGALPQMWSLLGDGALASIVAFVLFGFAIGHLLGGPDSEGRAVLAISTASRHPGVVMAIAASSFPTEKLMLPAMLMYLLVNRLISIFFFRWHKNRNGTGPESGLASERAGGDGH